jgi:hypothetical protein
MTQSNRVAVLITGPLASNHAGLVLGWTLCIERRDD